MIQYEEAIQNIHIQAQTKLKPLEPERVPLDQALGRICYEAVLSPIETPEVMGSLVDGYAIHSEWTRFCADDNPLSLPVQGCLAAGDLLSAPQSSEISDIGKVRRVACEVMTGAPIPLNCNAMVKVEDVEVQEDRRILIRFPVEAGTHIRKAGDDFQIGTEVIGRGEKIQPRHLMALASVGITEVSVFKKIRAVILSTGKELVNWNAPCGPGQVRNSVSLFLKAALFEMGIEVLPFFSNSEIVGDSKADFIHTVEAVIHEVQPDVLLTTGGVSMGKFDYVPAGLQQLGAEICFHRVAIRPGKPILMAQLGPKTTVFGLPGNPISAAVGTRFFLEPYLRKRMGRKDEKPAQIILNEAVCKPSDLQCFYRAKVGLDKINSLEVLPGQASFRIRPFLEANAWAVFPAGKDRFEPGEGVSVYPISYQGGGEHVPNFN